MIAVLIISNILITLPQVHCAQKINISKQQSFRYMPQHSISY